MRNVFAAFDNTFFCGHSHIAGIHTATEYISPEIIDYRYELNGSDVVVNVGSVGQPRDQDSRACYVLLDGTAVQFVRLEYDMETTRRKLNDGGFGPTYWDI